MSKCCGAYSEKGVKMTRKYKPKPAKWYSELRPIQLRARR